MEDPVEQEPAAGSEGFDNVPAVARAEGALALEEDVIPRVPEPVGQDVDAAPADLRAGPLEIPQAHGGGDAWQRRVLDALPEPAVGEEARRDRRRVQGPHRPADQQWFWYLPPGHAPDLST